MYELDYSCDEKIKEKNKYSFSPIQINPVFTVKLCYYGDYKETEIRKKCQLDLMLEETVPSEFKYKNLKFIFDDLHAVTDFYVIINYPPSGFFYEPSKTIVIQNEPWCFYQHQEYGIKTWPSEWRIPDPYKFLKVFSPHNAELGLVQWMFKYSPTALYTTDFSLSKTKIISSIVSSKNFDPGHINRNTFLKKYKDALRVDVFGKNKELSIGELSNEEKYIGIAPYKYYIAVENNKEPNYITEKLFEGIVCECLVFYDGAHNVGEWLNKECYIPIDIGRDGLEGTYNIIKTAIENEEYEKRLPHIKEAKKDIIIKYSFFPSVYNTIYDSFVKLKDVDQINEDDIRISNFGENNQFQNKVIKKMTIDRESVAFNNKGYIKKTISSLSSVANIDLNVTLESLLKHINLWLENTMWESEEEYLYATQNLSLSSSSFEGGRGKYFIPFGWHSYYGCDTPDDVITNYFIPIISFYKYIHSDSMSLDSKDEDGNLKIDILKEKEPTFYVFMAKGYEFFYPFLKRLNERVGNFKIEVVCPQKIHFDDFADSFITLKPYLLYPSPPVEYIAEKEEKYLFSFIGSDYDSNIHKTPLRKAIFDTLLNHPQNKQLFYIEKKGFDESTILESTILESTILLKSRFALCPQGKNGPNTYRVVKAIERGAIPVFFKVEGDNVPDLPGDMNKNCIFIDIVKQKDNGALLDLSPLQFLANIPLSTVEKLKTNLLREYRENSHLDKNEHESSDIITY